VEMGIGWPEVGGLGGGRRLREKGGKMRGILRGAGRAGKG